jgi:Leucine-rich repeat (LRR) protein
LQALATFVTICAFVTHARDTFSWLEDNIMDNATVVGMVTAFPSLKGLVFENLSISGLSIVSGLKHLIRLSLEHDEIGKSAMLYAISLITRLQYLQLRGGDVSETGVSHLITLKNLRHLNLHDCYNFTDAGLLSLAELTELRYLLLSFCNNVTDVGVESLTQGLTKLKELNMVGCEKITGTGLGHLSCLTSLQRLELTMCRNVTDTGLQMLVEGLPDLLHIEVTGSLITSVPCLSQLTKLVHLNLQNTRALSDASLQSPTELQFLDFSHSSITDIALQSLAVLTQKLLHLNLSCCQNITDGGVQAGLAGLTSLLYLNLHGCNITDASLASLVGLACLETLLIGYTDITDIGLHSLAGLHSLKRLELASCDSITDACRLPLASLESSLLHLSLHDCANITDAGKELLELTLPETCISFGEDENGDEGDADADNVDEDDEEVDGDEDDEEVDEDEPDGAEDDVGEDDVDADDVDADNVDVYE